MSATELSSNPFFDLSWILKYLLYPPNQADHPLVERDRQGLLAGTAPLFRPTVFISMVTSEPPPSAGFLFTTVMGFSFQ